MALNNIGTQQAASTQNTLKETAWLMDFLAHHLEAKIRLFAGNMQLAVDSNASYLVAPGGKSRYARHFYLEIHPHQNITKRHQTTQPSTLNAESFATLYARSWNLNAVAYSKTHK